MPSWHLWDFEPNIVLRRCMTAHYILRLSHGLQASQECVQNELIQLCHDAPIDEVTFMIFAEPFGNGHDTLDEIRAWIDLIRPWKQVLENRGVAVSLNPWITVLHCDRGRSLKESQRWQTMMDWRGQAASTVVCPLDPGWRDYYCDTLALYAVEGFRVIWLEDDIRLANHAPLDWGGCFCPLHVAEFNRRAGTSAVREEIIAAMMQPGEPHPWRQIWLDMWDDTQVDMVRRFREVVEATSSETRLGLMSSGPMMHAMEGRHWERWWPALSGDKPSIHRPHFTGYSDAMGISIPLAIHGMDMNRSVEPDRIEIDPEIENSPHGWSKSFRQTAAHMVLAQVFGADRMNLSLYDYLGNPQSDFRQAARFLAGWKESLDWLSELFPATLNSQGVGCLWKQDMTARKHATPGASTWMNSLFTATHGWPLWLGGFGQAFQMRMSSVVNAIGGELAWSATDEEIRSMLGHGLLLDGQAAAILEERGFGPWLGLTGIHFITQDDQLYTLEELTDARFTSRSGALISMDDRPCARKLAQGQLDHQAEIVSVMRGPRFNEIGHGVIIFENELGGRVAVCPWDVNATEQSGAQRNSYRAYQIQALVRYLARGSSLGSVSEAPWLVSQFFSDGISWRGLAWNASPDAVSTMQISLPSGMENVAEAVQLDADGNRFKAEFKDGKLHLPRLLHQWECVVLYDGKPAIKRAP